MTASFAMQYGPDDISGRFGRPIPNVACTIYVTGTNTLATLYTSASMASQAGNPISTDSLGNLTFFAAPGAYDISVDSSKFTVVLPFHPSEPLAELNSPAFTGLPTAPTATPGSNTNQLATTSFVTGAVGGGGGPPGGAAGGDLSGNYPNPTVAKLNGTSLAGLATGILKNTTSTGVPSIAVAGTDYTAANASVGGDLSGTLPNPTVAKINGTSMAGLATGLLKNTTGTGVPSIAVADTDYTTPTGTETLTNKRITRRYVTVTQSATPTINTDNTDTASITGLAQAITSMTTNLSGTPNGGDTLIVEITDNGTARAITWGASFESSTVALPTTTVINAKLTTGLIWNVATSKWRCVAVA